MKNALIKSGIMQNINVAKTKQPYEMDHDINLSSILTRFVNHKETLWNFSLKKPQKLYSFVKTLQILLFCILIDMNIHSEKKHLLYGILKKNKLYKLIYAVMEAVMVMEQQRNYLMKLFVPICQRAIVAH